MGSSFYLSLSLLSTARECSSIHIPLSFYSPFRLSFGDRAGIPTVDIHVDHDPARHDKYRRKASKQGILRVDDLFGIGGQEPVATRGGVAYDP